jgi:hypothetical protein
VFLLRAIGVGLPEVLVAVPEIALASLLRAELLLERAVMLSQSGLRAREALGRAWDFMPERSMFPCELFAPLSVIG